MGLFYEKDVQEGSVGGKPKADLLKKIMFKYLPCPTLSTSLHSPLLVLLNHYLATIKQA